MRQYVKGIKKTAYMWVMTLFILVMSCVTAKAAPVYEKTNIESQMMVGQIEIYTYVSWKIDGKSDSIDIVKDTVATSSNENVIKAAVEYHEGDSSSTTFYMVKFYALAEGTATISITDKDKIAEFDVQVLGSQNAVIENLPTTKTMNKGSSFKFELKYTVTCGSFKDSFWMDDCSIVSDNPAVVSVTKESGLLANAWLKANAAGTANIIVTINKAGMAGITKSFPVTVVEGPVAQVPVLETQLKTGGWVYSNRITVGFRVLAADVEYEIYRSKSKNKGFKKVGSVSLEKDVGLGSLNYYSIGGTGMTTEAGDIYDYDDITKDIKPNKSYYYKIRARHTDSYNSNEWSEFSKVQEYYTAPAVIKDKKVKFNKNTRKTKVPKVKKAAGYIYTISGSKKSGINIFLQQIYYSIDKTRTAKKNVFTAAKLEYGVTPHRVRDVIPYVKHGKYYYAHGYKPTKKLKKFNAWDDDKYV